jgi:hypothetical protein
MNILNGMETSLFKYMSFHSYWIFNNIELEWVTLLNTMTNVVSLFLIFIEVIGVYEWKINSPMLASSFMHKKDFKDFVCRIRSWDELKYC